MKKKLLFVAFFMQPDGCGACSSVVNFVHNFENDFDIDIAVIDESHGSFETIKNKCKIIKVCENTRNELLPKQEIKERSSISLKIRNFLKRSSSIKKIHNIFSKPKPQFVLQNTKFLKLDKKYDIVTQLSAFDPYMSKFANNYVNANKKFAFIHADFTLYRMHLDIELVRDFKIITVSKTLACQFKKRYPSLNSDYLYNFQNTGLINQKAQEEDIKLPGRFNIVTCVRLSPQKAIPRSIRVFGKLLKKGFDFHWTIVGDGPDRTEVENLIKKYHLQKNITLVGAKPNPFSYMKAADLFFLGSICEAAPMVYGEAFTLGIPILTTNIISAKELIKDYGFICNNNSKAIYKALKRILKNPRLLDTKKEKLKNYKYPNDEIKQKFLQLASESIN